MDAQYMTNSNVLNALMAGAATIGVLFPSVSATKQHNENENACRSVSQDFFEAGDDLLLAMSNESQTTIHTNN